MKPELIKEKITRILSPILGTALTIGICIERMAIYSEAQSQDEAEILMEISEPDRQTGLQLREQSEEPLKQLGTLDESKFKGIKTRQQACKKFDGFLVAYYDQNALVQNCRLRMITDPLMLNLLNEQNRNKITEIPSSVYRLFPHGKPIRETEVKGFENLLGFKIRGNICKVLENQYVTATGVNFYLVENCKRRVFPNYASLQEHNQGKKTIKTITPGQLAKLKKGSTMGKSAGGLSDIWMSIDGDVGWQREARNPSSSASLQDTPEKFRAAAKNATKPVNSKKLCNQTQGKLVAFYGNIYLVEKCKLREVQGQSLKLQVAIQKNGIRDLTSNERRALGKGKPLTPDQAIKKLR